MDHDPLRSLDRLRRTLLEIDKLPRRLSVEAAPLLTRELHKQYAAGVDPYGRKWRKLSTKRPSHLTESGRLRRATKAAPLPGGRAGVRILFGSRSTIAGYHQTGTGRMPARKILPERGMPASWRVALDRAARALARAARVA